MGTELPLCGAHLQKFPSPRWDFLLTCPNRLSSFNWDRSLVLPGTRTCQSRLQNPIAPMGDSYFAHCLQGGGVYVSSGTVTITSSSITGNTANYVRVHVQKLPSPPWETHVLLVVCRVAVSLSGVAQWPSHRATSLATQLCAHTLKRSHRPDGKIC
jgi:hypothetical protein